MSQAQELTTGKGRIGLFLAVSFGLGWALVLPAWWSGAGLGWPVLGAVLPVMMLAPTLAVLVVWWRARRIARRHGLRTDWPRRTGLGLGPDRRRTWRVIVATWVAVPVLVIVTVVLSAAIGVLHLDLPHLGALTASSGLATVERTPGGAAGVLALTMLQATILGTTLTVPFAFGEEWGWRGWLQPELIARWGTTRGLVATGAIWGLWHAPLTLLGYNYPSLGPWAAVWFLPFSILVALALGPLRQATGSVWPAVVGHAAINSTAGFGLLVVAADDQPDSAWSTIGVVGWVVLAGVVAVLPRVLRRSTSSRSVGVVLKEDRVARAGEDGSGQDPSREGPVARHGVPRLGPSAGREADTERTGGPAR